jgi:hypothetical protein
MITGVVARPLGLPTSGVFALEFPSSLWSAESDRLMAQELVGAFQNEPIILTDELANVVYVNPMAEKLFDENAEALVNRLVFSLLGFGKKGMIPKTLEKALLGEEVPWRGVVDLADAPPTKYFFAHGSAIQAGKHFICGVIRLSAEEASR